MRVNLRWRSGVRVGRARLSDRRIDPNLRLSFVHLDPASDFRRAFLRYLRVAALPLVAALKTMQVEWIDGEHFNERF
jgi:hypothetical protein